MATLSPVRAAGGWRHQGAFKHQQKRQNKRSGILCHTVASSSRESSEAQKQAGRVTLVFVAGCFGSLAVAIKSVLSTGANAPSVAVLSAVRGILAALCFVPAVLLAKKEELAGSQLWRAAFELAIWNLLAQGLLNASLALTSATKASFLTQTAIVMTPLIAAFNGQRISMPKWVAAACALAGVVLLASPGNASGATNLLALAVPQPGDLLALAGALSYSIYIIRIGSFAELGISSGLSQALKTILLAPLYSIWAVVDVVRLGGFMNAWSGYSSLTIWLILIYSAIVPGALADVFQARGQEKVEPAEAQVILASEPIFSAVFSAAILGERLGPIGIFGAALVVVATLLATRGDDDTSTNLPSPSNYTEGDSR